MSMLEVRVWGQSVKRKASALDLTKRQLVNGCRKHAVYCLQSLYEEQCCSDFSLALSLCWRLFWGGRDPTIRQLMSHCRRITWGDAWLVGLENWSEVTLAQSSWRQLGCKHTTMSMDRTRSHVTVDSIRCNRYNSADGGNGKDSGIWTTMSKAWT